jgi:hypothetical protein
VSSPFQVGKLIPPASDEEWESFDRYKISVEAALGEKPKKFWEDQSPSEMWLAHIDCKERIGYTLMHEDMIEVRGESKEIVEFIAQQIVDKLNDPKTQFLQKLKLE